MCACVWGGGGGESFDLLLLKADECSNVHTCCTPVCLVNRSSGSSSCDTFDDDDDDDDDDDYDGDDGDDGDGDDDGNDNDYDDNVAVNSRMVI